MFKKTVVFIMLLLILPVGTLFAAPTGGSVVAGDANIAHNGSNTTINQGSDKAIINWDSFGIGANESVHFNQLNSNSITLNRVTGGDRSVINGQMTGNGKVFLLNGNGIIFGAGSSIDLGSFIASTGKMSDADFLNDRYNITDIQGDIENKGKINVDNYGYAALLGRKINNTGVITANLGRVEIASGESFRLSFYDNNLIGIEIEKGIAGSYISNTGKIAAEGGTVFIAAKGLSDLIQSTVNNEGIIYAGSISHNAGRVILSADNGQVLNSKLIDVSADIGYGGNIEISGDTIVHSGTNALINADGNTGGNVYINSNKETTLKDGAIISASGKDYNGGAIYVLSDGITFFDQTASLFSQSRDGDGGFIEVSAVEYVAARGRANTLSINGKGGEYLIDPTDIVITTTDTPDANSISYMTITEIVDNLATNGSLRIETSTVGTKKGDITIATDAQGILLDAPNGDLTLQASNDIILTAPNWNLNSLTMIAANNITINAAGATNQIILADNLNAEVGGNFTSTGVSLSVPNMYFTTHGKGNVLVDTVVAEVEINANIIDGDFSLTSTSDITVNEVQNAEGETVDSLISATNITLDTSATINSIDGELLATNALTLNSTGNTSSNVLIMNSSFRELSAFGNDLNITNNSPRDVTVHNFNAVTRASYTQGIPVEVNFVDIGTNTPLNAFNVINKEGSVVLPFDIVNIDFNKFIIQSNQTTLYSEGNITLGPLNTPVNIISYFLTNLNNPTFLILKSKNDIDFDYADTVPITNLSLVSETGKIDARCTGATGPCNFTGLSTEAMGNITITDFGPPVMSVISYEGDVNITFGGNGISPIIEAVAFSDLKGDTVTIIGPEPNLANNFKLIIVNADIGILNLDIASAKNPSLNMSNYEIGRDLAVNFIGTNNVFSNFSIISAKNITLNNAFGDIVPASITLDSDSGNIILPGGSFVAGEQLILEAQKIIGATDFAVTTPFSATSQNGIYINSKGTENTAIAIAANNLGLLDLRGNITATINAPTTIGNVAGVNGTSLAGNITINAGTHELSIGGVSDLTNLNISGTDLLLLSTAKINATDTIEFNLLGTVTGAGITNVDGDTEQAFMSADTIIISAVTIGGEDFGSSLDRLKLSANKAVFTTTGAHAGTDIAINIESGNPSDDEIFTQLLFKYQFKAAGTDTSYLNGRLVNPLWHDALNDSRDVNYRPILDLADIYKLDFNIYDNLLALGDDLIISDIVYPKYIHTILKNRSSTTGNFKLK